MAKSMAMGSRPKQEYEKKLVGLVSIITGEKTAKLTLLDEGKKFSNGTNTIKIDLASFPKHPRIAPNTKEPKEFRVRMNQDGDEVEALTPARGHFMAKLIDLGPRPEKDSDPAPYERVFDEGGPKEERHLEFWAVYQITSGVFKGCEVTYYGLHYKFEEDPENEGYTRFAGNFENRKATRLFQLRDWGNAHGLWDEPVPWDDDTILPTLLERALDNDREVEINIANGYILKEGGVMPTDGYNEEQFGGDEEVEEVDEVEKEFPKKSAPAKETKKPAVKKIKKQEEDEDL